MSGAKLGRGFLDGQIHLIYAPIHFSCWSAFGEAFMAGKGEGLFIAVTADSSFPLPKSKYLKERGLFRPCWDYCGRPILRGRCGGCRCSSSRPGSGSAAFASIQIF